MTGNYIVVTLVLFLLRIRSLNALGNSDFLDEDYDGGSGKRVVRQTITDDMVAAALDPGPLVNFGKFCRKLPIDVKGNNRPEVSPAPVKYTVYYIDDTTPNTLHVLIENIDASFRYDYLVAMALNEEGYPTGHFHLLVCASGAKRSGMWRLGLRCNKGKDPDRTLRKKFGNPHIMYVEKDTNQRLSEQSIFWSWIPRDSPNRPETIQFRFAVVQKSEFGGNDKYWIITTYQIKFRGVWKFIVPLASQGLADLDNPLADDKDDPEHCYEHPLKADSPGNFQSTDVTQEIAVNPFLLTELFPVWFDNASSKKKLERMQKIKEELLKKMKRKDLLDIKGFMLPPSMGSVLRSSKTHKEIYNGCSVVKNCLGESESCIDHRNCQSLVTYRNMEYYFEMEQYIRFELQTSLSQGFGYAAVGISTDKYMGDDSVVECSVGKSGEVGVYNSWNLPNKTNIRTGANCSKDGITGENLKNCKLSLRDNVLACSFHLRKDLYLPDSVNLPRKTFNLARHTFYLLRASGSDFVKGTTHLLLNHKIAKGRKRGQMRSSGRKRVKRDLHNKTLSRSYAHSKTGSSLGRGLKFTPRISGRMSGLGKHKVTYVSPRKMNLKEIDVVNDIPLKLKYIKWHVAFVVVAFLGLIPNGVFVARYFKETWTAAMIFNISIWRLVHMAYMLSVVLLLLIDLITLLSYSDDDGLGSSTHRICGYLFYAAIIVVQPLLGLSTSYLSDNLLCVARVAHWAIGTFSKVSANIFIAFSPQMIDTRIFIGIWVICFLDLLFSIIMHATMTVLYHSGDVKIFQNRRNSHGKWMRAFNPLPMTKIHKALPGERRRFLLYLWHQFGTAVFASLIIVPYTGYNRLFICKDEPLALYRVICQNPGKSRLPLGEG